MTMETEEKNEEMSEEEKVGIRNRLDKLGVRFEVIDPDEDDEDDAWEEWP